jgi:hypothetical protein
VPPLPLQREVITPQQQPQASHVEEVLSVVLKLSGGPTVFLQAAFNTVRHRSTLFSAPSAVREVTVMASTTRVQVVAEEGEVRMVQEVEWKVMVEKAHASAQEEKDNIEVDLPPPSPGLAWPLNTCSQRGVERASYNTLHYIFS